MKIRNTTKFAALRAAEAAPADLTANAIFDGGRARGGAEDSSAARKGSGLPKIVRRLVARGGQDVDTGF